MDKVFEQFLQTIKVKSNAIHSLFMQIFAQFYKKIYLIEESWPKKRNLTHKNKEEHLTQTEKKTWRQN